MELTSQLQCFSEFYLNEEGQFNQLRLSYQKQSFSKLDAHKLTQCKELRHLSLYFENIDILSALDLSNCINDLTYLQMLQLNLKLGFDKNFSQQNMFCYIGNLKSLKVLKLNIGLEAITLYYFEIFKQFTQQVNLLNSLEILKVCFKGYYISDELVTNFAKQIAKLVNLCSIKLDFTNNCIKSLGFQQIVSCLQKYQNLQTLSLIFEQNQIRDEGLLSLSKQINNIPNLLKFKLNLNKNYLQNESLYQLFNSVTQCFQLQVLALKFKYNYIKKMKQPQIDLDEQSKNITQLQNLKKLNLDFSEMFFESNDVSLLTYILSQANELKQLNLFFNQTSLNNQSLFELGSTIQKIKSINEFVFSANSSLFTEKGIVNLGEALLNSSSLKTVKLFIQKNNLNQQGVSQFIKLVFQLPLLSQLVLELDFPGQPFLDTISRELLEPKNLKTLVISFKKRILQNEFDDEGLEILAKGLARCQSLNNLTLLFNKSRYTEDGLNVLPKYILQLRNLKYFKLYSRPSIKFVQNQKNIFLRQIQKSRRLVFFKAC
ncbi:hypothetical protein ABPG72_022505 [Tetrahymena utriculariae]